jgi:hypothetical protein
MIRIATIATTIMAIVSLEVYFVDLDLLLLALVESMAVSARKVEKRCLSDIVRYGPVKHRAAPDSFRAKRVYI